MKRARSKPAAKPEIDAVQHLEWELAQLDAVLLRRAAELQRFWSERAERARSVPTSISHDEIAWLLGRGTEQPPASFEEQAATREGRLHALAEMRARDEALPLLRLAELFQLHRLELEALVVCLAPELRRRYDRIYAYLQDDVTRTRPSVDLVLDLYCRDERERWQARPLFDDNGALFRHQLLRADEDVHSPSGSSGLARMLRIDPRILGFVLGDERVDVRLRHAVRVLDAAPRRELPELLPPELPELAQLLSAFRAQARDGQLAIHLHGPDGVGKKRAALALCRHFGWPLLVVDVSRWLASGPGVADAQLRLLGRELLLQQAPVYFEGADALFERDSEPLAALLDGLREYGWLRFFGTRAPVQPAASGVLWRSVGLPPPGAAARLACWRAQPLAARGPAEELARAAHRYRFVPGQIAAAAADLACRVPDGPVEPAQLLAVCRAHSGRGLHELAREVQARKRAELVLPADVDALLDTIVQQVRHEHRVLEEWQFSRRLPRGRGLSVLFSGPPGVGKTLAAQVLADELGLELHKVDLSGVVSKYIGETEKNLGRIFDAAQTSNALLFFDEADALFGKRTEVQDAHDRYANIEVSYLLQKMEEYEGVLVLATNLRDNLDAAFCRRIRFMVEFPFPDADCRSRIWRKQLPAIVPQAADVDYEFLGNKLKVAGGNIRNIALNAAFLAAARGDPLCLADLLVAARQEYQKIGKLWDLERFVVERPALERSA